MNDILVTLFAILRDESKIMLMYQKNIFEESKVELLKKIEKDYNI
jgi:hypothetical protein